MRRFLAVVGVIFLFFLFSLWLSTPKTEYRLVDSRNPDQRRAEMDAAIARARSTKKILTPTNDKERLDVDHVKEQERSAHEKQSERTVAFMRVLKRNLRNPDSVVWEGVWANDDGSVVCINYRAQNGFGGMTRESIATIRGRVTEDTSAWHKNCLKMTEMPKYTISD